MIEVEREVLERPGHCIAALRGRYGYLSNFYNVRIEEGGETYWSVEAAYQAAKTDDPHERRRIALIARARDAKRAGRRVRLRDGWDGERVDVMRRLLAAKFDPERNGALAVRLLNTGMKGIFELNQHGDRFWGITYDHGGRTARGENMLGILLMERRAALREAR